MKDNNCTNNDHFNDCYHDLSTSMEGIPSNHSNKCQHTTTTTTATNTTTTTTTTTTSTTTTTTTSTTTTNNNNSIIGDINHTNNNELDIMKRSNSCKYNSFNNCKSSSLKRSFPCDTLSYHHIVWKPVSTFITNLQSKLLNHSNNIKSEQTNQFNKTKSNINHFGRFNIGCPSGCNSSIADMTINEDYQFYKDIIQSSSSSSELLNNQQANIQTELNPLKSLQYMEYDHLSKISTDTSFNASILVKINVSGTIFHVRHSTLKRDPFVYGKMLEDAIWISKTKEYYFERDPVVFRFILCYLRRGELHLPHDMCGPLVEKELDDWGIALGLDIQRCCLGPVMESKSKLESLHRFEEKLEPEAVQPDYWIQSYRWQLFREKIWSVIDISPRLIHSHFNNYRHRKHYTPNELFPNEYSSTSDQSNPNHPHPHLDHPHEDDEDDEDDNSFNSNHQSNNQINQNNSINNKQSFDLSTIQSINLCCSNQINKCSKLSNDHHLITNHESIYLIWLRHFYFIYETLIITSAVGVFMLSTVKEYRIPFYLNITEYMDFYNDTISDYNDHLEIITMATNLNNNNNNNNRSNINYFTLPSKWLVQMDIFFSIAITIDVLIRMIFCPCFTIWLFSLSTLIDILSLIPFYCEFIFYELVYNYNTTNNTTSTTTNTTINNTTNHSESIWWLIRILRVEEYFIILKVFVVLRLFRLLRRHRGTRVLFYTICTTITDLSILIILILVSALFFGAAIYFVDPTFNDIPKGFWWALITMSTVGYGDLVPNNKWGYLVAIACIILGTLLVSYTIPVLVNHFLLYYAHADQLSMVKQLHRTAKRKIRNRKMSRYLQKALYNAKSIVNSTITNVNHK
ncbi:unnamed protein product [Schistosoma spindalis]|nr:unnamed protein product [Schistosoma spindale]